MTRDLVGFKYMSDEEVMPSLRSLGPKIVSQGSSKVVTAYFYRLRSKFCRTDRLGSWLEWSWPLGEAPQAPGLSGQDFPGYILFDV